jgi:hypothetical protein
MPRIKLPRELPMCKHCTVVPAELSGTALTFVTIWSLQKRCQACAQQGQEAKELLRELVQVAADHGPAGRRRTGRLLQKAAALFGH